MANFVEETIEAINGKEIKEFKLNFLGDDDNDVTIEASAQGSGKEALMNFFGSLPERAKNYYNGYGSQEWDGWISFQDGTWIERREYDGSEWWAFKACPKLS